MFRFKGVKAHLLCFFLFVTHQAVAKQLAVEVQAESAIMINADTGAILYEKEAYLPQYPASITKVPTLLYSLLKASDQMDVMITADQDSVGTVTEDAFRKSNYTLPAYHLIPDGSHIGIKRGEELSLKDLMYGMMLASGDDAANVIAKYVGGTIPDFVAEMNGYVKSIGCTQTTFYNPHGLHHPKQLTTAYDMALIAREGLKIPIFREIVSTARYTRPKTNKQEATPLIQTNRLLRRGPCYYPKAIGIKTGWYSLAGSTLVGAAKEGDRTLIVVLLKNKDRKEMFLDAIKLFETAFSQPQMQRTFLKQGEQKFQLEIAGGDQPLKTYSQEELSLTYYPAEEPSVKCFLQWDPDLALPVVKDQRVGEVLLQTSEGTIVHGVVLYAREEISPTLQYRTTQFFEKWFSQLSWGKAGVVGALAAAVLLFVFRKKRLARFS